MTYDVHRRDRDSGAPTGLASDLRIVAAAALLTFGSGVLMLIGYLMVGAFGVLLALFGAGLGWSWWSGQHGGKLFPRELPTSSLTTLAAVTGFLTLVMLLMA